MILTSNYPNVPLYVGNPATDLVRRDNARREVIEPVKEMERSAAEKGVQSDDKGREARQTQTSYFDESKTKGLEYEQAVTEQDAEQEKQGQPSQQQADPDDKQAEQKEIAELKARDLEVRMHEQTHAVIGGQYAGGPSYTYETGPDGRKYAVGGEVQIDVSVIPNDPQATIEKMQQVRSAALAPDEPSGADRAIAAEASRLIQEARTDLLSKAHQEFRGDASAKKQSEFEVFSDTEQEGERDPIMLQRSQVIAGFYAKATVPSSKPLMLIL